MDLGSLLSGALQPLIGGGPTQNVAQPAMGQGQQQPYGITPLGQAVLAAYLGGVGTSKHKGIGDVISNAGFAGLNTYNQARQMQDQQTYHQQEIGIRNRQEDALGPLRAAETQKAQIEADNMSNAGRDKDEAIRQVQQSEMPSTQKALAIADIRLGHAPTMSGATAVSPEERARQSAAGKFAFDQTKPISSDANNFYLNKKNLQPVDPTGNISIGDAEKQGIRVNKDDMKIIRQMSAASSMVDQLKEASAKVLPKQSDLGPLGTVGSRMNIAAMRVFNPDQVAELDSAISDTVSLARTLSQQGRLPVTEYVNIQKGLPSDKDTLESATTKINNVQKIFMNNVKGFSPDFIAFDYREQPKANARAEADATSNIIQVPGYGPVKRIK